MRIDRRGILGLAALLALPGARAAASPPPSLHLWPGAPPGGGSGPSGPEQVSKTGAVSNVHTPRLLLHRPAKPNGAAIVVISGGGYRDIELGTESGPTAEWLQSLGVTAFELIYRLPNEGWPVNATFMDGARAMRLVRSVAAQYGFAADRVGVIGFSAGGHLAGMTTIGASVGQYKAVDATDALSAAPDVAGLIYPVLTMMPPWNVTNAAKEILGADPTPQQAAVYSVERHVGATCPPVFLAQAADDPIATIENSLLMFDALRKAKRPGEMHVFQQGGHGWGLGKPGTEVAAWPALFATWAGVG